METRILPSMQLAFHSIRMNENGVNDCVFQLQSDRASGCPDISKEPSSVKPAQHEHKQEEMLSSFDPRPPRQARPPPLTDPFERVKGRRLKTSQESLTDCARTGGAFIGPLKEDLTDPSSSLANGPALLTNGPKHADQSEHVGSPLSPFRDRSYSLPVTQRRRHQFKTDPHFRHSRIILSPLQPCRALLPSLECNMASMSLRTANQIDRDCVDYKGLDRLHRNFSDSRLLETMVSDSSSVNSMKSNFSVLNPIRPKDVRNRQAGLVFDIQCRLAGPDGRGQLL